MFASYSHRLPANPVAFLAVVLLFVGGTPFAAHAQRTLVQCGTLIDPGVAEQPMTERTLVVEEGRIEAVVEGYTDAASGDVVVDLRDAYCMPGLIDSHTHMTGQSRKGGYIDDFVYGPADRALQATVYARRTLMAGFTTVRDVGAGEGVDFALRDAINRGEVVGPRMFVSGTSLAITGGHGDPKNGYRESIVGISDATVGVVDGVENAMHGTRLAIKRGADHIKITATGGVLSLAETGSAPQFTEEEIAAIVQTASDRGLKVAAHAHGDEGMQRSIRAGISSIEHGTYMSDETMRMMRENNVYLVPTITAGKSVADSAKIEGYYTPAVTKKALEIGPKIQATFARAYEAGVPIAFGTDAGVFRHGRNYKEFEYMTEAGMPIMEALYSATVSAADLVRMSDELGTLEPGKRADVIATTENPLDDVSALSAIDFVMKDGVVYKQDGAPAAR